MPPFSLPNQRAYSGVLIQQTQHECRQRAGTPTVWRAAHHLRGQPALSANGDSALTREVSDVPGSLVKLQPKDTPAPLVLVRRPLPSVLILHTGGTLGMDPSKSFEQDVSNPYNQPELRHGTGGHYGGLRPGQQLHHLLKVVPELSQFAHLDLHVAFNKDSSRVGPREWVQLAKILHTHRYAMIKVVNCCFSHICTFFSLQGSV